MLDWLDLIALILVIVAAVFFFLQMKEVAAATNTGTGKGIGALVALVLAVCCIYWTTRMLKDTAEEHYDWAVSTAETVNSLLDPTDPPVPPPNPPLWE